MTWVWLFVLAMGKFTYVESVIREYYIASQDIDWNYIPGGGQFKDDDAVKFAEPWTTQSAITIGPVYRKVSYFQYTDATFLKEIPKDPQLGLLGPLIKGEVGDSIVIHFLNNATGNFSIHPHAVFYEKGSEAASSKAPQY